MNTSELDSGSRMCFGPPGNPLPNEYEVVEYETAGLTTQVKKCASLVGGRCQSAGGATCIFNREKGDEGFEGSPVVLVGAHRRDVVLNQRSHTVGSAKRGDVVPLPQRAWNTLIALAKNAGSLVDTGTLAAAAVQAVDSHPQLETNQAQSAYVNRTLATINTSLGIEQMVGVAPLIKTVQKKGSFLVMPRNVTTEGIIP